MNEFNNLSSTRKGRIAEDWIEKFLTDKKVYDVFVASKLKSNPFDGHLTRTKTGQKYLFEVKCKTKTEHGSISIHHNDFYNVYKKAEEDQNRPMIIFLVDPKEGKLYLTTLDRIEKSIYKPEKVFTDKIDGKRIIYFTDMDTICKIPASVINEINAIKEEENEK